MPSFLPGIKIFASAPTGQDQKMTHDTMPMAFPCGRSVVEAHRKVKRTELASLRAAARWLKPLANTRAAGEMQ